MGAWGRRRFGGDFELDRLSRAAFGFVFDVEYPAGQFLVFLEVSRKAAVETCRCDDIKHRFVMNMVASVYFRIVWTETRKCGMIWAFDS